MQVACVDLSSGFLGAVNIEASVIVTRRFKDSLDFIPGNRAHRFPGGGSVSRRYISSDSRSYVLLPLMASEERMADSF